MIHKLGEKAQFTYNWYADDKYSRPWELQIRNL